MSIRFPNDRDGSWRFTANDFIRLTFELRVSANVEMILSVRGMNPTFASRGKDVTVSFSPTSVSGSENELPSLPPGKKTEYTRILYYSTWTLERKQFEEAVNM